MKRVQVRNAYARFNVESIVDTMMIWGLSVVMFTMFAITAILAFSL